MNPSNSIKVSFRVLSKGDDISTPKSIPSGVMAKYKAVYPCLAQLMVFNSAIERVIESINIAYDTVWVVCSVAP